MLYITDVIIIYSILYACAGWNGMGTWKTGDTTGHAAHRDLLAAILPLGFDPSQIEAPSLSNWPLECSPKPIGEYVDDDDPFFIDWIASILKVSPGKHRSVLHLFLR